MDLALQRVAASERPPQQPVGSVPLRHQQRVGSGRRQPLVASVRPLLHQEASGLPLRVGSAKRQLQAVLAPLLRPQEALELPLLQLVGSVLPQVGSVVLGLPQQPGDSAQLPLPLVQQQQLPHRQVSVSAASVLLLPLPTVVLLPLPPPTLPPSPSCTRSTTLGS